MKHVLAFDVYGTLIDTAGLVSELRSLVGPEKAADFSHLWREKQLEYSFRRGLMRRYDTFAICTRDALEYACAFYDAPLAQEHKQALLDAYRTLPAFNDVKECLEQLQDDSFAVYAFSNGTAAAVDELLTTARIREYFLGIVSVDELQTFKPNPDVYRHFLERAGARGEHTWLVSGNPFDVIGAIAAGMRAAWVRRSNAATFDPWGIEPTLEISGLRDLGARISTYSASD